MSANVSATLLEDTCGSVGDTSGGVGDSSETVSETSGTSWTLPGGSRNVGDTSGHFIDRTSPFIKGSVLTRFSIVDNEDFGSEGESK